ncbi:G-protein alpha subunit [Laetiporus sulphureus 93-53]|uniref:G-protein alpha subunit n=1 Tax=Laetiporus sulphureus 93-53 TaxID=1314785 RepID=A0A165D649_9APHY|nr:G-protein alpha subunit [Laetiporus sulphureus 93-53]KZT04221.1 G-protein alpha subunit [Laetiporus sulphureus 93-53]
MPARCSVDDAEAIRINNQIDEEIKREHESLKRRRPREVKVMLLGQAESGKSTLQKQFQLYYASQTLDYERPSWRPIVYFNVLKAIRMILTEIDYEYFSNQGPTAPAMSPSFSSNSSTSLSGSPSRASTTQNGIDPAWMLELSQLRSKLLPLVASEDALASELSGGITVSGGRTGVYVRAGWQALSTATRSWPLADIRSGSGPRAPVMTDIVAKTLAANAYEIEDLWHHPAVRTLLATNDLRLEEYAALCVVSFFGGGSDGADEMLPASWIDMLHVRLQTLGVKEHSFDVDMAGTNYTWLLYDVGGARGQRHAWVPYFEDATAIIFLAPISAFDQYLEEDPRTNRIDDSLQLFTTICSNKLLQKSALVLMLNKALDGATASLQTDLLKQKIDAGIKVRKYISSYGDRPNTYEEVSEYFRAHFIQAHRRKDVYRRSLFVHFTSMLDIKATQRIIVNVNEAIMRKHMATIGLA